MKPQLIVGPPGTGKTTSLLRIVELFLMQGTSASNICFVAFTRKAANEARDRAMEKFGLTPDEIPWFRTLHSLAFKQLGMRREHIMGLPDYFEIANKLGLYITMKGVNEDGTISGLSKGDRLFFMESMARATMTDLRTYWEASVTQEDINWYELKQVGDSIRRYKEAKGKYDFTDIIELFVKQGDIPKVNYLIVDEAQDLTAMQWLAVEAISKNAKETYIAGDDDQAIFRWAGADVDKFIKLDANVEVLPQSWRVPAVIQNVANKVINRVSNRISKDWKPAIDKKGSVSYVGDVSSIDMSKGTWYLLARNVYLLEQYVEYCKRQGYVYESITEVKLKARILRAIKLWEALRRGEKITVPSAIEVYEFLGSRTGVEYGKKKVLEREDETSMVSIQDLQDKFGLLTTEIWHQALDRIPSDQRSYLVAALKRGESLNHEARIKINTIHGVKGGEADNVVLITDMAARTFKEYELNEDDEHRVWYVGITRAKENLYVIHPSTGNAYDL